MKLGEIEIIKGDRMTAGTPCHRSCFQSVSPLTVNHLRHLTSKGYGGDAGELC
uniref:hypothetical protein n=1 Tax=Scytonema sp. HK-05 TaxID=1137095 RepID=UPI001300F6C1|nr:hypothetical protein [Scytonema sp. HK-05]